MWGVFARTGLPQPVTSASYDAANELLQWNGQLFSYDVNGNMTSDGVNTFTWDARNQLSQINSTTFQYDAFRRRIKNAAGTNMLYDGPDSVQELSGTTPIANRITGSIDEFFSRADGTGSYTPLADAIGNVIGLVSSSGSVTTQYTYDPFGVTTDSGAANGNTFQYTGRENDGTGLYYYRNRYYNPLIGRFISEDPLGFEGGDANFYSYAGNDPINRKDPLGLASPAIPWPGGIGWDWTKIGQGVRDVIGGIVDTTVATGVVIGGYLIHPGTTTSEWEEKSECIGAIYDNQGKPCHHKFPKPKANQCKRTDGKAKNNNNNDDCDKLWAEARAYCSEVMAIPRDSPEWENYKEIWGGSYDRCVRGQVPERCGGNRVE
jgi:RHS repeat-associated protein